MEKNAFTSCGLLVIDVYKRQAFVPPDEDARYLLLEAAGRTGEVIYRLEGAEEQRWPIRGNLCLRTVPAPGGRWPETGPADFNRARERLERTRRCV